MSDYGIAPALAAQTLAEIAEIDRRIASLIELRDGLKRVFVNASRGDVAEIPCTQLDGSRRAMVECIILDMLESADGRCLKTRELFEGARAVSAHLKYVTFRSYLHRLKQRGVISAADTAYGAWRLVGDRADGQDNRLANSPR
jgi:predicted transcriptional regulator